MEDRFHSTAALNEQAFPVGLVVGCKTKLNNGNIVALTME